MVKKGNKKNILLKANTTSNSDSNTNKESQTLTDVKESKLIEPVKEEVQAEKEVENEEKNCTIDELANTNEICFLCEQIRNYLSQQKKENKDSNFKTLRDLFVKITDKILFLIFEESLNRQNNSDSEIIQNSRENINIIYDNYGESYSLFIIEILLERISYVLMVIYQKTFKSQKETEDENLEKIKQLMEIDKNNKLMKTSVTTHNCKLFKCSCKVNHLYYENNLKKLEIISSFEKSLDHLFSFYTELTNAHTKIQYVFSRYLRAISSEKLKICIENVLKIELKLNINCDKVFKPLIGKINSIKHEFSQLENYKINSILKDVLFYNSADELIKINEDIKKLYSKNPFYIKYEKQSVIDGSKSTKEDEKSLEDLLNFIINDNNCDKSNKKSKKKKKNKDCKFKNCFNNPEFKVEDKVNKNENDKVNEVNKKTEESKDFVAICGCDHFDIIVENFRISLQESSIHSSFCVKTKPSFTKEWLERFIQTS